MKIVLAVLGLVLDIPFLIPVRPVKGTVLPRDLADTDSRLVQINGIDMHYKTTGQGEPALVLLP